MKKLRIVARLDIKNDYVIKGIHLEGLRKIGSPNDLARKYYFDGVDEILLMDAVASLYGRNSLFDLVAVACKEIFVPITVGGGIRSLKDIEFALKSGADKVGVNTQAIREPRFITNAARAYGSQCIVGSIEAKKRNGQWEAYVSNGREASGIAVADWARKLQELGAGEILLTSIDQEGTKKGFDIELARKVADSVAIPVICSGGGGSAAHVQQLATAVSIDAIAVASILHYQLSTVSEIKSSLLASGVAVRV
jgi:cyclase